jgi:mono/diheme cytochrome c family protein
LGFAASGRTRTPDGVAAVRAARTWIAIGALAIATTLGAAAFVWSGLYDISANVQHTQAVYSLLETTMHRSVRMRASKIAVPRLDDERSVARGGLCFREKCVQCHGGPGVTQAEIGRSMQPLPGPLVDASARWKPAELYWITRNGIKMSGMPAWQHRLADEDLWALVAFMQRLPRLTAAEFRRQGLAEAGQQCAAASADPARPAGASRAPDADRGRAAVTQYACNACHRIPGVTGSDVNVGPPLAGFAARQLIAGKLPNDHDRLVRWIKDPQSVDPLTTMPDMQVSDRDAQDIAAFLRTLR